LWIVAIEAYCQCILWQDDRKCLQMSRRWTDFRFHKICVCLIENKLQTLDDHLRRSGTSWESTSENHAVKPIAISFTILEITKLVMYDFGCVSQTPIVLSATSKVSTYSAISKPFQVNCWILEISVEITHYTRPSISALSVNLSWKQLMSHQQNFAVSSPKCICWQCWPAWRHSTRQKVYQVCMRKVIHDTLSLFEILSCWWTATCKIHCIIAFTQHWLMQPFNTIQYNVVRLLIGLT